ncbi:MAG: hypothetical protein ACUVXI_19160 [bacterium]
MKKKSRPGHLSRAKENATTEEDKIVPTTELIVIIRVFLRYNVNGT